MQYTYGGTPSDVLTTPSGDIVPDYPVRVRVAGTGELITALYEADGVTPIGELRSNPADHAQPGAIRQFRIEGVTAIEYEYLDADGQPVRWYQAGREVAQQALAAASDALPRSGGTATGPVDLDGGATVRSGLQVQGGATADGLTVTNEFTLDGEILNGNYIKPPSAPPQVGQVLTAGPSGTMLWGSGTSGGYASLDALPPVATGAHRGGRNVAPEETMTAFRAAVAAGVHYLDMDARVLGDGSVVIHHDATVDRITSSSGSLSRMTAAGYKTLRTRTDLLGGGAVWPALDLPTAAEVLDEFGGKIVMTIECKDTAAIGPLARMIRDRGLTGSVMLNTNTPARVADIKAEGVLAHLWRDTSQYSPADVTAVQAAAPDVLEVSYSMTDAQINEYKAALGAGARLFANCSPQRAARDRLAALGVQGIVGDDPAYMGRLTPAMKTDPFPQQTWWGGAFPGSGTDKGTFETPNAWGYAATSTEWRGLHQGWAAPIAAAASSYTISAEVKLTAATVNTAWLGIYFGLPDDRPFVDGTAQAGVDGWAVLCRQRGDVEIYKIDDAIGTRVGDGVQTTVFPLGTWVPVTIAVTPTQITARRSDTAEAATVVTDSAYRGGHLWLAAGPGAAGRFRNIVIS